MTADPPNPSPASFPKRLDRLAEVAVRVGVGLAPGQDLIVTGPVEALPFGTGDYRRLMFGRP